MTATIVVGAQWGDEGKGRVADWLAAQSDVVGRFGGGDNAGHTVYAGGQVYKLHLIPSGILHKHVVCVLGNGTVINPVNLVREMDDLRAIGLDVTPERLIISTRAHIVTPAHVALDKANELARGADKIGTTLRGIGPAYLDKTGRQGIRAGQMIDIESYGDALYSMTQRANQTLMLQALEPLDPQQSAEDYIRAAEVLRPYLHDSSLYINRRLREGAKLLCEGAQGTMLDIDHGDYPFVTSSSPTAGGALTGLGFGPRYVDKVIGVAKCFSTRVGSGPMPTELDDEVGARLRGTGENFWDEYGTTTGRPRRTGWLDVVMLRYADQVNGFTEMVMTKLDILSGFDELKICIAYDLDGQQLSDVPDMVQDQWRVKPVYETLPGWQDDVSDVRKWADLPAELKAYVARVAELVGVPVSAVAVGPDREQLVFSE